MILTELLGAEVHAETRVGYVTDVRFLLDEVNSDQPVPPARLHGLVVSPHSKASSMGFERTDVRSPWPVAAIERWLHRDSFLVHWADLAVVEPGRIQLRPGYTRLSARLPSSAVQPRVWG